ncbi:putative transposase [Nitrobacter sp. Nb-311A]|nr:putative transposase [Nitrobacter sp. Nb-311A]
MKGCAHRSLVASPHSFRRCYGSCYKAFAFRDACRDLDIKHIRTKPYTPKTNGKAERFIQTALREWAYAQAYPTSDRRAEELPSGCTDTTGIALTALYNLKRRSADSG